MDVLECMRVNGGMGMVELGGKSMTRPRSQRMIWSLVRKLKFPNVLIQHHLNARLPGLVWGKVTVCGPKLTVAVGQGLLGKILGNQQLVSKSFPSSIM